VYDRAVTDLGTICPPPCGNGRLDAGETCDGTALQRQSCQLQGFPRGGTLKCNSNCNSFDISSCDTSLCGDGTNELTLYEIIDNAWEKLNQTVKGRDLEAFKKWLDAWGRIEE